MKKNILFLTCLLALYPIANAQKYYCPQNPNSYYSANDIYDSNENCESWNSSFWKKNSPSAYQNCLKNQEKLKQRYNQGKCEKITTKTHNFGNSTGEVELVESQRRVISKLCSGGNGCMEKLDRLYSSWN